MPAPSGTPPGPLLSGCSHTSLLACSWDWERERERERERKKERKKERKMACWDSGLERVSLASNGHALHSGIPALGTNQGAARLAGAPLNRDLPSVRRPWNVSCTTFPSSSVRLGRASMMTDSEFRIPFVLSFALCCSRFLVIYIPRQAPNTVSPRCHMEVGLHSNRRARP